MKIEVPYFQTQIWIFIWANLEKSGECGSFPLQKQANSYGYLLKLEPFTKRMNCFIFGEEPLAQLHRKTLRND